METLTFTFPARTAATARAHAGVAGSGDLEVLLYPDGTTSTAGVRVRTSIDGYSDLWDLALSRFFGRHPVAGRYVINDCGATPGVVALRLLQAIEASET